MIDLLHFCSNSDGSVLSVDRLTGESTTRITKRAKLKICSHAHFLPACVCSTGQDVWRRTYASPVMAIYSVENGNLRKLPSTSVAADTLSMLTGSSVLAIRTDTFGIKASDSVLQYVTQ